MIIIHKISSMHPSLDDFYVAYPKPEKVRHYVNVHGIHFTATPIRVHEHPFPDFGTDTFDGEHIWVLAWEWLYFTSKRQAEEVFTALYGRNPDHGAELLRLTLTKNTAVKDKVDEVIRHESDLDT